MDAVSAAREAVEALAAALSDAEGRVSEAVARAVAAEALVCPDPDAHAEPAPTYGPTRQDPPTGAYTTPGEHGAKGDGSDDAAALQRALDAAEGGVLWLPPDRTYCFGSILSIRSNTRIVGAGPTSVLKATWRGIDGGDDVTVRSHGPAGHDIHIANFVLEGGGDGLPGGLKKNNPQGLVPLLRFIKVVGFSVRNMELRNADGLTVTFTGCQDGVIERNHVHHSGRDGITMYRNSGQNVVDVVIIDNLVEKTGDDAIAINGLVPGHNLRPSADGLSPLPRGIVIARNVIRGWGKRPDGGGDLLGRGVALNGVADVLVEGNEITDPNGTGILLTGCNRSICEGSATDWWSEGARVVGNRITRARGGSRPGAITVIKTRDSQIVGNTATDSDRFDFAGAVDCTISGNTEA